jgi:hypothetical protein
VTGRPAVTDPAAEASPANGPTTIPPATATAARATIGASIMRGSGLGSARGGPRNSPAQKRPM